MQLHNGQNWGPAGRRDALWELIPWYVNGSLPAKQADEIKAKSKTCADFAAEIMRQRDIASEVRKPDLFDVPLARNWQALQSQIKAEERARSPKFDLWEQFVRRHSGTVAFVSVAAMAALVMLMPPEGPAFQTLTTDAHIPAGNVIKFQLAVGVSEDQLSARLAELGLTLIVGPSETGVYQASVPTDADADALAVALIETAEVAFAATEVAQ
ncbi:hypothetical protein SLH49_02735 [Cognatiyoonia sp. IB215446]|uniref:hypothetical protein n=1 Tax=Cognatiyoonia sp. IB215446 TaxID=3097355 RepID=UPI002A14CE90|nr:hypothetical protein [Cognatiyoonia sp. IB215446]MDX8346892.1 hypothetical protein [Cognatiyoonia sp. IB215446]